MMLFVAGLFFIWSKTSMPTVTREGRRAEEAGIVITEKVGPIRFVRAGVDHPLYSSVRRIILAIYGPPIVVAEEFADVEGVDAVLRRPQGTRHRPGCAPGCVKVVAARPGPQAELSTVTALMLRRGLNPHLRVDPSRLHGLHR